jgi:DNA repair exonuclease SbcCD nuclease subunit
VIVFSDLHLSEDSAEVVFQKVLPGILEAAKNDSDRLIACLGDFWHVRYKIPVALQNQVVEWLRALKRERLQLYLLPGNHDQINGAGENALEVFADLDHVTVITEPTWNRYGLWIPYRKDRADLEQALALPAPSAPAILWMHHGVKGAEMAPGVLGEIGLEPHQFLRWKIVLCGHFHKRQALGNIIYVGSPYQVTAAEAGQVKGYGIWNPITEQFFRVDTVWGRRFHNLDLAETNARDFQQAHVAVPGDEVRLRGVNAREAEELVKGFSQSGVHCVAEVVLPKAEERLDVGSSPTLASYAEAYARKFLPPEEVEIALALYREIIGGVRP